MRDTVSPIIQMAMVLAVILWWRQPDRPELFPFKKRQAPHRPQSAPQLPASRAGASKAAAAPQLVRRRRRGLVRRCTGQGVRVAA